MRKATPPKTAPLALRLAVYFLSILLTFLWIWLLGFFLADIGDLKGPDFEAISQRHVDQALVDRTQELSRMIRDLETQIRRQEEIQGNLKSSMNNARDTMQQMMNLHRLSLEQKIQPSDKEQEALATSQTRFLDAQDKFEAANKEISLSNQTKFDLSQELASINQKIQDQRVPANQEYQAERKRHNFMVASLQLAFIVPLFLLAAWLVYRYRSSAFQPIYLSILAASFWKVGRVMFQHFPREFFKYIAIVAAIFIVLAFLIWILRRAVTPGAAILLKRFREAYAKHQCPICAYPIARGALKQALWTRKGPKPLQVGAPSTSPADEIGSPYACPSCGTHLYQKCGSCGHQRHSLLPYCESCGQEQAVPLLEEEEKERSR